MKCLNCESTNCQKISMMLKTDINETEQNGTNFGITISNSLAFSAVTTRNEGKSSSLLVKEVPKAPLIFNPGHAFLAYAVAFGILEFFVWLVVSSLFDLELKLESLFKLILFFMVINSILSAITCYFLRSGIRQVADKSYADYQKWERLCICKACGWTWEANF